MPIPTYEELLRPILQLATEKDIKRRSAADDMADAFHMTQEEREAKYPSGSSTYIRNRAGWAMTFLTKAGLIEKVGKHTYRATEEGRRFLQTHPEKISEKDLRTVEGYREAWQAGSQRRKEKPLEPNMEEASSMTPEERIDSAVISLDANLQSELLEQLRAVDPFRFEQIVLDLLFAMGYGGSREEAAKVTKKSNDEGIDGVINEDRLGLDVVYIQAKRWKEESPVGRKEIQSFVGALAGKQAHKGIFITTSFFAATAIEYARNLNQKVVLIDGGRLADLMIEHNIGVSTVRTITLKRLDSDYFEES